MSDFSNMVLITDLDGTLLPQSKIVSEKDLEAIEYFKSHGGIFTVATGRIYQAAEQFFDVLRPNAPVIMNNGGLIYDIEKNKNIYINFLDKASVTYTKKIMEIFPEVGVEVNTADKIYVVNMTEWEQRHLSLTHLKYEERSIESLPDEGWCKVLFSIEGSRIPEIINFTSMQKWDKTSFVASGEFLFECLPKDCTKGSALKRLSDMCKWDTFTVAAAGDYNNDLEMLDFADIAFAPQNSIEIVKRNADYVSHASCEDNAIAEMIHYLENVVK